MNYFYDNHSGCGGAKTHICYCNECGSTDLRNPRTDESDHRQVTRFTCNNCGYHPYNSSMCYYVDDDGEKRYV